MFHQLLLIIKLKWVIFKRQLREIPPLYLILLAALIAAAACVLIKMDVRVTYRSLSVAAIVQILLCAQIPWNISKQLYLKQYSYLSGLYRGINYSLLSLPFLLIDIRFWLVALCTAIVYTAFANSTILKGISKMRPIIPSPFFVKSSYLWHSRQRYLLPLIWAGMILIEIIAHSAGNYNLAIVVLVTGSFIAFMMTIMQYEKIDFIRMYADASRFMAHTAMEIMVNTAVFIALPVLLIIVFFPQAWQITSIAVLIIFLMNIHFLWMKYGFYPSEVLSGILTVAGLFIQGALVVTVYGLIALPPYYYILYRHCKKNIHYLLANYEAIDH
ncbi:MAG TPA: hypothetical protein DEF88_02960 [Porphyromonadaceae bacterium]|jgi:hypothetical protein|nr:hypothetical protein [Porphyromonadaceae bacterium]HBX19395.1 hypothetical protein [Porphyromonadaceae bacterium]HCM21563.1 hypothetical protein [Porphyromonadaceae bacterium]